MSFLNVVAPLVGIAFAVLMVSVAITLLGRQSQSNRQANSREPIRRHSDYVEILCEHDDGYGLALADMDHGYELRRFDGADEVSTKLWLRDSELDVTADALSVKATETELREALDA